MRCAPMSVPRWKRSGACSALCPGRRGSPADIAGRIDAALAAEALLAATAPHDDAYAYADTDTDTDTADVSRETTSPEPASDVSAAV